MSLQMIMRENSLEKKEDYYIFIIKAYVIKNIKHYEFVGKVILNEQGKVLKKETEKTTLEEELIKEVFENEKIINYVQLVSWVIKSMNDLQKITEEDIQCVKKECEYILDNNHYVFICKFKNQPELKFRTVISKEGEPEFRMILKDEIDTSYLVTNILTKNIKKTIIKKKYRSKEKVRLLINGFYLDEKRNEE